MLKESYYHDTSCPVPTLTLNEILQDACRARTDRHITWADPYEKMTYAELYQRVQTLSKGLLALGLKRGDTFCSLGSQGSDSVVLLLACASLGLKYTANYLYAPISKVITMMLKKIGPTAVLVGNCTSGKRQEHVCTEFTKVLEELSKEGSHGISHIIYDRKAEADPSCKLLEGWKSFSSVLNMGGETVTDEALSAAKSLVTNEDAYLYLCSSGSTGDPKIVTVPQRTFAIGASNSKMIHNAQTFTLGCNDIIEGDVKLLLVAYLSLIAGHNIVIFPANNSLDDAEVVEEIISTVEKHQVQMLIHRLDYIIRIVDTPSFKQDRNIGCLIGLIIGGCLSSFEFKKKLMEYAPFSADGYAGTEFLYSIQAPPMKLLPESKLNTVGRAAPNVELKIIDEEGVTVPINTKGELCVRGWSLFLEYKDQPEVTAKAMDKYGWYHTGDMLSMDEDGYIYHYGRTSNAVRWKVNGKVIYSISIESVLITHPSIRTCAVIGTDNGKGHDLNYVVEPAPGSGLTTKDVQLFATEKMYNSLDWPVRVFLYTFKELPMTNGSRPKLDRRKLTEEITLRVKTDPSDGLV